MTTHTTLRLAPRSHLAILAGGVVAASLLAASPAAATPSDGAPDIPSAAPPAAFAEEPELATPELWPFSDAFSRTSGTSRYDDGALLWTDWLFDDTGDGELTYADPAAHANGSDIFRAGVGAQGPASYWRVDFTTLADPNLPIAVWALDTDADANTGTNDWPGRAGITSPGSDAFLTMSSRGIWLESADGDRTDLTSRGARISVDEDAKSFVAKIPRSALRINGTWTVRLATGIADAAGVDFAPTPERTDMRVYNAAFRTNAQEDERLPGRQRATGWNNGAQSAALTEGSIAPFSLDLDWRRIAKGDVEPQPRPSGFSTRWYVSSVDLGPGVHPETREPHGQPPTTDPRVYGRVQPYLVYVPTGYDPATPAPLTVLLHGGGSNHNAYRGAREQNLFDPLCEERESICVAPLGRGDGTWYVNEAELDVWEVWNRAAHAYSLDSARTVVAGHSMGGVGATRFATNYPDVFAAVGIVSGAGYMHAAGGRDGTDDLLRVENLSNMAVFLDAGTADIAEGNTRDWAAAFEEAGVAHRAHYYAGATHGHFGWLGWPEFADHVDGAMLDEAPPRIAFRWDPTEQRDDLGLTIDSAYWVSGLEPHDGEAPWSRVEARSGALDTVVTEPRRHTEFATYDGYDTEIAELAHEPVATIDPTDTLDVEFTNIAAATIDLDAAGFAGTENVRVTVTTDTPVRITLRRGGDDHTLTVPDGVQTLAF